MPDSIDQPDLVIHLNREGRIYHTAAATAPAKAFTNTFSVLGLTYEQARYLFESGELLVHWFVPERVNYCVHDH